MYNLKRLQQCKYSPYNVKAYTLVFHQKCKRSVHHIRWFSETYKVLPNFSSLYHDKGLQLFSMISFLFVLQENFRKIMQSPFSSEDAIAIKPSILCKCSGGDNRLHKYSVEVVHIKHNTDGQYISTHLQHSLTLFTL